MINGLLGSTFKLGSLDNIKSMDGVHDYLRFFAKQSALLSPTNTEYSAHPAPMSQPNRAPTPPNHPPAPSNPTIPGTCPTPST